MDNGRDGRRLASAAPSFDREDGYTRPKQHGLGTAIECTGMATLQAPEQKVILKGISWETYQRLLAEHEEQSDTRFTYDSGVLQIMVLSARHEEPNRTLAALVEILAEELAIDIRRLGSTTLQREDLAKGFDADSCFYIQRVDAVFGKTEIDLTTDPPPDLVIEVDISSPSLDKLSIFAAVGIPEVWRCVRERVIIFRLEGARYVTAERSRAFPVLTSEAATRFLQESAQLRSTEWLRRVRTWARGQET